MNNRAILENAFLCSIENEFLMVFSRMVDKTNFMCRSPKGTLCEGWMLFPARSNPLRGLEIAYPSGTLRGRRAQNALLAMTPAFLRKFFP
jgi:hypothetical protein